MMRVDMQARITQPCRHKSIVGEARAKSTVAGFDVFGPALSAARNPPSPTLTVNTMTDGALAVVADARGDGPQTIPAARFDYGSVSQAAAIQMRKIADAVRQKQGRFIEDIADIGRNLGAVKKLVGHGHFLKWIEAEFDLSDDTARNYIHVAETFGDKIRTVRNLPPAVVYKLAAPSTPAAVREQVVRRHDAGEIIPSRAVVAMIDEAKDAAKKAAADAKLTTEQKKSRDRRLDRKKKTAEQQASEHAEWLAKRDRLKQAGRDAAALIRESLAPDVLQNLINRRPGDWEARSAFDHDFLEALFPSDATVGQLLAERDTVKSKPAVVSRAKSAPKPKERKERIELPAYDPPWWFVFHREVARPDTRSRVTFMLREAEKGHGAYVNAEDVPTEADIDALVKVDPDSDAFAAADALVRHKLGQGLPRPEGKDIYVPIAA